MSGICFLALAVTITFAGTVRGASLTSATGLLTDGQRNPMAVDSGSIWFTWMVNDSRRGTMQTAYQILVGSSRKDIEGNTGDMWNSGRVKSSLSAGVVYEGKAVSAATRYWWKVRIWDNHGEVSPWSEAAIFDVGLSKSDWEAKYIWDGTTNRNNFAYFRKTFSVSRKPELAKIYVMAHNDYMLFFNGHLLGRGPARSNPYSYGQYNAYDISKFLRIGTNVFVAMGHWQGNWNATGINAEPAFLLETRLDYPDGSCSTICTDGSWKVLVHTPFIEADPTYFHGKHGNRAAIRFDSRREPTGWKEVNFVDSAWANATVVDRPDYNLFAQRAPLEREQASLKPVSITQKNGAWLVDFGRCIDGWPEITMHVNHPGDTLRVQYFQMNGGRYPAGWDEYICHGGTEIWDAYFGRHASFQEIKIIGYAGKLKSADIRGMWAYCDADVAGRFDCSSPLLNGIYKMCERSARQNIQQGIISVDANREQTQWLADSYLIGNVLLYNDRNTMMIDKVVRDYAGEQLPDGFIPACSPGHRIKDYPEPGQADRQIPEWAMYWPMLLWQQYLFSGDTTLLHEMEPHLTRLLNWLKPFQDSTTKLLDPPGWRISDYPVGNMPSGGYNIATACQYYDNLRIASRVSSVLGRGSQSHEYWQQAEAVKSGINDNLFNGKFYLSRTDRKKMYPLASAWALRFSIEPAADRSKILNAIEHGGEPDIGGYGGDALYAGLFNSGGGAFAVNDLARYRPMLESDKACWENFHLERDYQPNHAWTSYPAYIFLKYICGIQPTSGGFATFDIRPDIGGLVSAKGTVPTVKGLVTTSWKKTFGGNLILSVDVPANTSATVYVPRLTNRNVTITESGKQLWPKKSGVMDPGVIMVSKDGTAVKCLVGSGHYRFHEMSSDPR